MLTVKGIELQAYEQKDGHVSVGGVVDWIQVDNQDPAAQRPVVLAPTPTLHHTPTLTWTLAMAMLEKKRLFHVDYCGIQLMELDLNIEKTNVLNLTRFVTAQMERHDERGRLEPERPAKRSDSIGRDSDVSGIPPDATETKGESRRSGGTSSDILLRSLVRTPSPS